MKDFGNMFELIERSDSYFLKGKIAGNWVLIDAEKLVSRFKKPFSLHYYVYAYHGSPRFVFVTKAKMNVHILETYGMYGGSFAVTGALYDNRTQNFVSYNGQISLEYIIHDAGIPHIIYDRISKEYAILGFSTPCDTSMSFIRNVTKISNMVTHIQVNVSLKEIDRFRAIFYFVNERKNMLIISNDLDYDLNEEDATLAECFDGVCKTGRDDWYLYYHRLMFSPTTSLMDTTFELDKEFYIRDISIPTYIISGDGAIIVEDPKSKFGNMTMIIPGDDLISYGNNSFFEYQVLIIRDYFGKKHNVVKMTWARNDFDNSVVYFDIHNRKEMVVI